MEPYFHQEPPPSLDWPVARRDRNLSGRCPGKGKIRQPRIVASVPVPGDSALRVVNLDLDGDGAEELLFHEAGRLVARAMDGKLLWQTSPGGIELIAVQDLTGRGTEKHLCVVFGERTLGVLSGSTGRLLWSRAFKDPAIHLTHQNVRVGPLLSGVAGSQITLWAEGDDDAWLFSFEDGVERGREVWRVPGIGKGELTRYRSNVISAAGQIIVVEHSVVWGFEASTGRRIWEVGGPKMRNYGFAGLFDVDADGAQELVLVNNAVQLHLSVIKLERRSARYLWDLDLGMTDYVMSTTNCPVADVDGDGKLEIFYSLGSLTRNDWRVEVRDPLTRQLKASADGCRVVDAADLDGDGVSELLIERPSTERIEIVRAGTGGVRLVREVGSPIVPRLETDDRLDRSWKPFWERVAYSLSGRVLAAEEGGAAARHLGRPAVILAAGGGERPLVALLDGETLWIRELSGALVSSFAVRRTCVPPTPFVADMDADGTNEILVGGAAYRVSGPAGSVQQLWTAGNGTAPAPVVLCVSDLDGDGRQEVVIKGRESEVTALDSGGRPKWTVRIKGDFRGGGVASCFPGHFTDQAGSDVCVNAYSVDLYRNELVMLNGRTGHELWRRKDGHDSGLGPVDGYAALRDMDGDGLDDLFILSGDVIMALNGADGHDIISPVGLSKVLGTRWVGSGHLALEDIDGDRIDEIFLSGVWGINSGVLSWGEQGIRTRWHGYYGNETTTHSPPRWRHQGIARTPGGMRFGGQMLDHRFGCFDAASGSMLWAFDLAGAVPGETVTCDLDGDGSDEFLFGTNDGYLHCLSGEGRLLFRMPLDAPVGNPVIADVDGDGEPEILVTTTDGVLYVIE